MIAALFHRNQRPSVRICTSYVIGKAALSEPSRKHFQPVCFAQVHRADINVYAIRYPALWSASGVSMDGFITHNERGIQKTGVAGLVDKLFLWKNQLSLCMGFYDRCGTRLKSSPYDWSIGRDSILLAAVQRIAPYQIVGLVEIGLELPDGRLSPPVRSWEDSNADISPMQPYLSNLNVLHAHRGRGIAKHLTEACEAVVVQVWQKDRIYLHAIQSNIDAVNLYEHCGYLTKKIVFAIDSTEPVLYMKKEL